ncbi:heparan sulfate 2-O-sulfotransferase 1-like isoform X1 [Branchiostoma floridae]|uniref:Heparan sulfate 2-O-sulfotransferase 1 n=1 Tax=Branchiostoma floridae TaxID=7739 RepID=A0A9J7N033_BRAFL|nr:heparan sulfate 2-O-sulfotransferase 1-like isoform X1 [Branchiostoma floridae]
MGFSRTMQTRYQLLMALLFVAAIIYLENQIQRLEAARDKMEHVLATMQLHSLQVPQFRRSDDDLAKSNDQIVIYNRVPKTASTSFVGLAYDLCQRNGYNVIHLNTTRNSPIMSIQDQERFVTNVTNWNAKKPVFYHGHLSYLEFGRFGLSQKPVYINIVRKPLDRLVSYYYFVRWGDDFRPHLRRNKHGDSKTFDDCVEQGEPDCAPEKLWMQVPFFCGHAVECWEPGNRWALEEAKRNLVANYFLVGVTEELEDFVMLLEAALPKFFRGATSLFQQGNCQEKPGGPPCPAGTGGKSHLRKTSNKQEPSKETIRKIQRSQIWQMENDFYQFALNQFHHVVRRSLRRVNGELTPLGAQFFYEKIRPR